MKCKLQSTHIIYQSIALEVLILHNIITPFAFFAHLVWFSYDTSHIHKENVLSCYIVDVYIVTRAVQYIGIGNYPGIELEMVLYFAG